MEIYEENGVNEMKEAVSKLNEYISKKMGENYKTMDTDEFEMVQVCMTIIDAQVKIIENQNDKLDKIYTLLQNKLGR